MTRNAWFSITITLVFLIPVSLLLAPVIVGMTMNPLTDAEPVAVTPQAAELHQRILIADLHADTLLWSRAPDSRARWGHLDLPRMREGNLALQAFSVVTKTPRDLNYDHNDAESDNITLLAMVQMWPVPTWSSLMERARHQAQLLDRADRRDPDFRIIHNQQELAEFLRDRRKNPHLTAGWLTLEGAHTLEGRLANVDILFEAGFRMIGIAHFFDNQIGGSAHGRRQHGLTTIGVEWLRKMEANAMTIDLAHASAHTIDEVIRLAERPLIVSHTGLRGQCDNSRNLTDDQATRIAAGNGLIGIGFWETATCGNDVAAITRALRYAVNLVGIDHVALGSDFDGAVAVPFAANDMAQLTSGLMAAGFTETEIRQLMGGNVVNFLSENLPK